MSETGSINVPHRPLPVMDVGPLLAKEPGALESLAAKWREACEGPGCFCLVNHGLPRSEIDKMETATRRFHSLPDADKLMIKSDRHFRGFMSRRAINSHDSRECLVVATEYSQEDPNVIAGKQFYSPNPWPKNLPGFREDVETYIEAVASLSKQILPIWATSLDLQPDYFKPYFDNGHNYLILAKYPRSPDAGADEQGLSAHADHSFITVLPLAREEGLQIRDSEGAWFWPVVPEGGVIILIGQLLSRWTNDRFRAPPHRVVPPKNNDRYAFACFVSTSFDSEIECLPTCVDPEDPPKYPKESYWDFFQRSMTGTEKPPISKRRRWAFLRLPWLARPTNPV